MSVDKRVMDILKSLPFIKPEECSRDGVYLTIHSDGGCLYLTRYLSSYPVEKHPVTGEWWSLESSPTAKRGYIKRVRSHSEMKVLEEWLKRYLASVGVEYTDGMAGSEAHNWWVYPTVCIMQTSSPVENQPWFKEMKRAMVDAAMHEVLLEE